MTIVFTAYFQNCFYPSRPVWKKIYHPGKGKVGVLRQFENVRAIDMLQSKLWTLHKSLPEYTFHYALSRCPRAKRTGNWKSTRTLSVVWNSELLLGRWRLRFRFKNLVLSHCSSSGAIRGMTLRFKHWKFQRRCAHTHNHRTTQLWGVKVECEILPGCPSSLFNSQKH